MSKATDMSGVTSRRRFLGATGSVMALSSLPFSLTASPRALSRELASLARRGALVLYREGDPHGEAFADAMGEAGLRPVALGRDPVRQWRDSLQHVAGERGGAPLLGLADWSDFVLISGLAAEHRRHPLLQWHHPVPAGTDSRWAAQHARNLLDLAPLAEPAEIQTALQAAAEPRIPGSGRARFSWLIT